MKPSDLGRDNNDRDNNDCQRFSDDELIAYCQKQLSILRTEAVDEQIINCAECLKRVNEWQKVYEVLGQVYEEKLPTDVIKAKSSAQGWVLASGWTLICVTQLREMVAEMETRVQTKATLETIKQR
jgi:anti-sigma factor RsiW